MRILPVVFFSINSIFGSMAYAEMTSCQNGTCYSVAADGSQTELSADRTLEIMRKNSLNGLSQIDCRYANSPTQCAENLDRMKIGFTGRKPSKPPVAKQVANSSEDAKTSSAFSSIVDGISVKTERVHNIGGVMSSIVFTARNHTGNTLTARVQCSVYGADEEPLGRATGFAHAVPANSSVVAEAASTMGEVSSAVCRVTETRAP